MPEDQPRKRLILVDAYSLLFRAFFGGRPLTTNDGRPTGALYGFANMVFSMLKQENPDAMIVCWDAHAPTLRSQEFEAYKAHRPETDPALKQQMPIARDLVTAFGIHSAELAGYEADDLIGTMARRGEEQNYTVGIFTGDTDQLQLVTEHTYVLMTQRGVSELKIYDPPAVLERYGVHPNQIADWKGLVGDTSDNIPGVPGIGEKTATALLQKWGTVENLLEHLEEVTPPKAKQALTDNLEQAKLSKRLAVIDQHVPIELDITPYAPTPDDWRNLRALFLDLEFKTFANRIPQTEGESGDNPLETDAALAFVPEIYRIGSDEQFAEALQEAETAGVVAVLPDATPELPMSAQLRGVAFATSSQKAYYLPIKLPVEGEALGGLFDTEEEAETGFQVELGALRLLMESPTISLRGHHAKALEIMLERAGLAPRAFAFDTELAGYLINTRRSGYPLSDLADSYLGFRTSEEKQPTPESLGRDAALVMALVAPMQQRLAELEMTPIMEEIEAPLIPVLAAIERAGLLVDTEYLLVLSNRMAGDMEATAQEIYALAGETFNISSTKQLQTVLFEKMKLPTGRKIKTGFSTGADLLEQLAPEHEIAQKILDYREVAKLKSTYADALPKLRNPRTGRVHTSLHQTVASTGRLSSSDPNVQNIPVRSESGRQIRRAFIAPKGRLLLSCDYSQIELRILAHAVQDPTLLEAFAQNADIHAATAARVFNVPLAEVTSDQRRQAKTINFGVIYGQSGFGLANTLGVDPATANAWIADYFERLPGVKAYIEETKALAHAQKYVTTLLGRRCYFPELDSSNHNLRQFAERAAVNMPIQGTAADIMKLAMINVHRTLQETPEIGCTLVLQVHDELLFEVDEERIEACARLMTEIMENAYSLRVHLKTDAKIGANWAEMTPI